MNEAVLVAIITGFFSVLGNAFISRKKSQEDAVKDAQREQRQLDRLERIEEKMSSLEHKVDIHNGYAEKFGEIATRMTSMAKDIEYMKGKKENE